MPGLGGFPGDRLRCISQPLTDLLQTTNCASGEVGEGHCRPGVVDDSRRPAQVCCRDGQHQRNGPGCMGSATLTNGLNEGGGDFLLDGIEGVGRSAFFGPGCAVTNSVDRSIQRECNYDLRNSYEVTVPYFLSP